MICCSKLIRSLTTGSYLGELGCEGEVHRNDKISVEEIARRKPEES